MATTDERNVFEQLFNKSAEELERIEGKPKKAAPTKEPAISPKEAEKDRRIRERIRMFNEGKDPDAKNGAALLEGGEFDEFAIDGDIDPMHKHLLGETPALPGEERQLKSVVKGASDLVYGEKMHAVVGALRSGGEAYIGASNITFEILKREKQRLEEDGDKAEPSVFFAETGAVPAVLDMVWDLGRQLRLPGYEDQDQYAGAVINVMRMAGEHIAESGDEQAIVEAEDLATTMAMTGQDGSMLEPMSKGPEVEQQQIQRKALAGGISDALLGGAV